MSSAPAAPAAAGDRALTRVIVLMALAAFASGASLRISDPLLPQVAQDFGSSLGAASSIATAYAIPYGMTQAFTGLIADRLGKCQAVVLTCALSCLLVLLCAGAQSVTQLALARFICAPGAAIIVPLGMAYVGDVVPYARRQTVLARFLAGQMFGMIAGQVAGGIIGDHFGWRMVFIVLAGVFAVAAAGAGQPVARQSLDQADASRERRSRRVHCRLPQAVRGAVGALRRGGGIHRGRHLFRRVHLRSGRPARAFRLELFRRRPGRRRLRRRLPALCRQRAAAGRRARRARTGARRRHRGDDRLSDAGRAAVLADGAARLRLARLRLLHGAQHAADQCHADAAGGSAAPRSRDFPRRCFSARAWAWRSPPRSSTAPARYRCSCWWRCYGRCWRCGSGSGSGAAATSKLGATACRAKPVRSRRARCARPGSADCRRARTSTSAATSP